ncbi:MAG: GNAT family N-acetyltransferase [Actinobacteria bacterium]|nr:GNAT family N-acetyltransferase [Actinomycetota bacterium]MCG2797124.1 N-acetyltransferase family protein [Cellulomonas sp.]
MSWVVRDATPQDATAIAAIYAPYVTGTAISFEDEPPSAATMAARIAQAQARYAYLVLTPADDPTAVVGYAYAGPFAARPAYRWSAEASVYVSADARGRGAGRALYDVLIPRLVARGYRRLLAGITVPNDASLGLHRSYGFTQVALYPKVGWKLGAWRDVVWLMLDLVPADQDPPDEPGV